MAELKKIPISQLQENSWNPNKLTGFKYEALVKQISKDKELMQPILVRKEENGFLILDGAHRARAAKQAGLTEIDCVIIKANNAEAQVRTLALNNIRGKPDDLPLASLLKELGETYSTDQLKELVAFNERELAYYLKLLDKPEDFTSAVELKNDIPVTLTFIVSEKESEIVNDALDKINPENKSKALVKLCLENLNGENS